MSLPSDNSQPPLRAAIAAAAGTTVFREREQEGEDEDNDDGDDDDGDDEDDEKKEGKEMRMSLGNNRPALRFWLAGFEDICRTWVSSRGGLLVELSFIRNTEIAETRSLN